MPKIYVNTDNSNSKAKIYEAGKMGKSAAAAEQKMLDVITDNAVTAGYVVVPAGTPPRRS
jgi:hypothetical protein